MNEKLLIAEIQRDLERLQESFTASQALYHQTLADIDNQTSQALEAVNNQHRQALQQAEDSYTRAFERIAGKYAGLKEGFGLAELEWNSPRWKECPSQFGTGIPKFLRVGDLTFTGCYSAFTVPALLPLIGSGKNLLIRASGAGKEMARQALQALVLRLLALLPPGKVRLIGIDPVGLGSTLAGFIQDLPDSITGGQAWFTAGHIEEQLANLEIHMANVKQKYLGVRYANIEQYNAHAGQVEEPYRFLIVSDFPARFSDSAAQALVSIATNGPETDVYLVGMVDEDAGLPYRFNLSDLERVSTVITCGETSAAIQDPDLSGCSLRLDAPPPKEQFIPQVRAVSQAVEALGEVKVDFSAIVPGKALWWTGDAGSGVQVPIGQYGAREKLIFSLDDKLLSSALIIGRQGSGKSTLYHTLIHSLAFRYAPQELELYLLDLKQVEFKDYALHQLPHAAVVAINTERDFAISVLRRLNAEIQNRENLFRDVGVTSLKSYRQKTAGLLPRIILLIDEFQELFHEDDALSREAAMVLDRLVRLGRALGINLILASQSLRGNNSLPTSTIGLIPLRIALQCSDADARLVLGEDNNQASLLERPGEAIYNDANGQVEGNHRFQVYWLSETEREDWLSQIRDHAGQCPGALHRSLIVFDGSARGDLRGNQNLQQLLDGASRPTGQPSTAWLGEPIEIKPHTAAVFRRQSGSNLLILGQQEYEAQVLSVFTGALISLAAQHAPETARFTFLNFTSEEQSLLRCCSEMLPHPFEWIDARRLVPEAVEQLYTEMENRFETETKRQSHPAWYVFIAGLQNIRDLRWPANYYFDPQSKSALPLSAQLLTVLKDGPDYGIHTLLWCDTLENLARSLDRNPEDEFDMRIAMQMNPDASHRLLGSEAASRLSADRALYMDVERLRQPEKFRPYAFSHSSDLPRLFEKIGKLFVASASQGE